MLFVRFVFSFSFDDKVWDGSPETTKRKTGHVKEKRGGGAMKEGREMRRERKREGVTLRENDKNLVGYTQKAN